jgi:hypothetical protein
VTAFLPLKACPIRSAWRGFAQTIGFSLRQCL